MDEYSLKVAKAQELLIRFERYKNYKVNVVALDINNHPRGIQGK